MREYPFELALCAHLEASAEAVVARQIGGGVRAPAKRVLDVLVVERIGKDVSGAGMVAASDKTEAVTQLLEFLTTESSQEWYAQVNNEFPVRPGVPASETLAQWGDFKADDLNLGRLGELNPQAVRLMDRAGWQ